MLLTPLLVESVSAEKVAYSYEKVNGHVQTPVTLLLARGCLARNLTRPPAEAQAGDAPSHT